MMKSLILFCVYLIVAQEWVHGRVASTTTKPTPTTMSTVTKTPSTTTKTTTPKVTGPSSTTTAVTTTTTVTAPNATDMKQLVKQALKVIETVQIDMQYIDASLGNANKDGKDRVEQFCLQFEILVNHGKDEMNKIKKQLPPPPKPMDSPNPPIKKGTGKPYLPSHLVKAQELAKTFMTTLGHAKTPFSDLESIWFRDLLLSGFHIAIKDFEVNSDQVLVLKNEIC